MLRHPTSPIGAGSKTCPELMPIDSVTLSDGRAWKNARRPALIVLWVDTSTATLVHERAHIRRICAPGRAGGSVSAGSRGRRWA
jgi:hypothetical protein